MIDGGLRGIFRDNLPTIHWQAVETGLTGSGVPDHNGCLGREFWIEYKLTHGQTIKKNKTTPFQISWHERRYRAGGITFLGVRRISEDGPITSKKDWLYIFPGKDIRLIYSNGVGGEVEPLYYGIRGPSNWDWSRIRTILTGATK